MKHTEVSQLPRRITDLIALKERDVVVTCFPVFEILPVDFFHQKNPYRAYIFLCRYNGKADGKRYSFRKCYARGCPENHCSHVFLAVLTANRYLQRDYSRLAKAGIIVEERLFTLEEMLVKYDGYQQEHDAALTLEDFICLSGAGKRVDVIVNLEYVPAVEHFSNHKNSQTFLTADFAITDSDKKHNFQRCLSCYQTDREKEEKIMQVEVANERLKILYGEFTKSAVRCSELFFS